MKIIHLTSGDLWAGAEVQLFHLATRLARLSEIDLLVVLFNHGQLEEELKANEVDVRVLDETALSGFSILKKFYVIAREFQPDIIHTHRVKENVIGGLVAKLNGKKSVRTVHGASEFATAPFNLRRLLLNGLDRLAGYLFQQKIIAVSEELKQKLSASYPALKLKVIENSIDVKFIENKLKEGSDFTINTQACNVAFVGRFVPVKRVDLFYEIAKATILAHPDKIIHFHMIGDGPLKNEIEHKVATDGMQDNIHLYGFVANTAPLIKQMDLLMFTSDHEGLPMTLLEAMTIGVPVLSRNLPGIRTVLCNGECGYILASDVIEDFVDVIASIAADETDAKLKSKSARKQIDDKYTIVTNMEKYLTLYNEVALT